MGKAISLQKQMSKSQFNNIYQQGKEETMKFLRMIKTEHSRTVLI